MLLQKVSRLSCSVFAAFLLLAQSPLLERAEAGDICSLPAQSGDYDLATYTYKYAVAGDESSALNLDFYSPQGIDHPPLVILIHGGAWKNGSRDQGPLVTEAQALVSMGYAVASIDYSMIGGVGPVPASGNYAPQQTQDVLCAVKWLKSQAWGLNFDNRSIAVIGHSAGAQLAGMIGTVGSHPTAFNSINGPDLQCDQRNWSGKVQAVVAYYPVTSFNELQAVATGRTVPTSTEPSNAVKVYKAAWKLVQSLMGPSASQDPVMLNRASPNGQVTYQDQPPFFIVHGSRDQVVPGRQSDVLASTLINHGFSPQNFRVGDDNVGLNHGFYPFDDARTTNIQNAGPYNMGLSTQQVHDMLQPSSCALVDFLRGRFGR